MTGHLVNFYFIVVDKLFIGITRYGVICIDRWEKYRLSFNKTSLKLAINYSFLKYYRKKWLIQTKKRDMRKAHIFSNIFKFIDDLFTFNSNYFENDYNDIYPDELEL